MRSVIPFVKLHFHLFVFRILCSDIVDTVVVRTANMLGFEVLCTHFEQCYVITMLWYVTKLTYVIWAELGSGRKSCP